MARRICELASASLLVASAFSNALPEPDLGLLYPPDHPVIRSLKPAKEVPAASNDLDKRAAGAQSLNQLFGRAFTCSAGYGYCSQFGRCCPSSDRCCKRSCVEPGESCCSSGYVCRAGHFCCAGSNPGCAPRNVSAQCCRTRGYCDHGDQCVLANGVTRCRDRTGSSGGGGGGEPSNGGSRLTSLRAVSATRYDSGDDDVVTSYTARSRPSITSAPTIEAASTEPETSPTDAATVSGSDGGSGGVGGGSGDSGETGSRGSPSTTTTSASALIAGGGGPVATSTASGASGGGASGAGRARGGEGRLGLVAAALGVAIGALAVMF